MYQVQFLTHNNTSWTNASSAGSEQSAIQTAKSVARRSNVESVRVLDSKGNVVYPSKL